MILGILSDSHGRHRRTAQAIRLLQGLGAEAVVHCGDLGTKAVLDELVGRRACFVWGNTDLVGPVLPKYAKGLGLAVPESVPLRLELAGCSIVVFHGHEPEFTRLARLIQSERIAEFETLLETLVSHSPLVRESLLAPRGHGISSASQRPDQNPAENTDDAGISPRQSDAGARIPSRTARCYILFGHSHRPADVRIGHTSRVRLINPGALDRARPPTVATLDLKRDVVRFWQVDDHAAGGTPPRPFHL